MQGFSGKKITPGMAFGILLVTWAYSILISSTPFFGWGDYMAEGLLITCTYDFLSPVMCSVHQKPDLRAMFDDAL